MFSVPMSRAPDTGIFSIPEQAFRIRDLDTGKEYALDKVGAGSALSSALGQAWYFSACLALGS